MALYHEWDVKNGFAYVLQYFSLSDGLSGVIFHPIVSYTALQMIVLGTENDD